MKIIKISKINNMRRAIKTCKHNIIVTDYPVVDVRYMLMNYRLLELGSNNCVQHCPQT